MPDPRQFADGAFDCASVELWLAEAAENVLPATIAERVRQHAASCSACQEKLAEVRRGREWLLVLKQESLEPPADLVARILARTSLRSVSNIPTERSDLGPASEDASGKLAAQSGVFGQEKVSGSWAPVAENSDGPSADTSIPVWQRSSVVVLRRTLLDPRLALVAAMAFFSISLTLNLLGFRLSGVRASDLEPQNLHRAITRQYADTNARVVRYYENLRIVYEVEARVQQLRRAAQTSPSTQPVRPRKQSFDSTGDSSGSSSSRPRGVYPGGHRHGFAVNPNRGESQHAHPPAQPDPEPIPAGPVLNAALRQPIRVYISRGILSTGTEHTLTTFAVAFYRFQSAPQASSCLLRNTCSTLRIFSTPERRLA